LLKNGARLEHAITFGRRRASVGYAYASAVVSGGRRGETLGSG